MTGIPLRWIPIRALWVALFVMATASVSAAGIRDDAPPDTGDDMPGKVVYRMGAVHFDPGYSDFTIACTNVSVKALHMVLEVYDEDDRRAGRAARLRLEPGATGTFASSAAVARAGDVIVAELPPIDHGKARISAKNGRIVCTALSRLHGAGGEIRELPFTLLKRLAPAVDE
jgi:hypothetical protein